MNLTMGLDTVIALILLLASGAGGYAVLNKRVSDLEKPDNITDKEHKKLCQIATLEMKQHITTTMANFDSTVFQPAIQAILGEIKSGRKQ